MKIKIENGHSEASVTVREILSGAREKIGMQGWKLKKEGKQEEREVVLLIGGAFYFLEKVLPDKYLNVALADIADCTVANRSEDHPRKFAELVEKGETE